jgi:hypothetical protein
MKIGLDLKAIHKKIGYVKPKTEVQNLIFEDKEAEVKTEAK